MTKKATLLEKSTISLLTVFALLSACAPSIPKTPEEQISEYDKSIGGTGQDPSRLFFGNEVETNRFKTLSPDALALVTHITMASSIIAVPDLDFLPSLTHLTFTSGPSGSSWNIRDISSIAGLKIKYLVMGQNPIRDIDPLADCSELESVGLSTTLVAKLPNLRNWKHLKSLGLSGTPIRSLGNLETIPSDFDLYLWDCRELTNIDALLNSRVNTLVIDKLKEDGAARNPDDRQGTYDRFEGWFKEHLAEIKARRPQFHLKFNMFE